MARRGSTTWRSSAPGDSFPGRTLARPSGRHHRHGQVVQPNFAGVGYHVFHHVHPISQDHWDQVVGKRWRELNPSFARMNHSWDWSPEQVETVARHMAFFQTTGTQIYLATWNPKDTTTDASGRRMPS